jgi:hypothetical protein
MVNYKQGKIYVIRSNQTDVVYVGSTVEKLCVRMAKHRANYKIYMDGKFNYVTSFKILEYEDAYIELVENYPCDSKEQLLKREGQIIRETQNCVNRYIAGRTKGEYMQDNKEKIQHQRRNHYEDNKEKIQQLRRRYYKDNREEIRAHVSEKIKCECGCYSRRSHISRHKKTTKHRNQTQKQIQRLLDDANHEYQNAIILEEYGRRILKQLK